MTRNKEKSERRRSENLLIKARSFAENIPSEWTCRKGALVDLKILEGKWQDLKGRQEIPTLSSESERDRRQYLDYYRKDYELITSHYHRRQRMPTTAEARLTSIKNWVNARVLRLNNLISESFPYIKFTCYFFFVN